MPHSLTHPERLTITGPPGGDLPGRGPGMVPGPLGSAGRAAGPPPPPLCCPICPRPAPAPPHGTGGQARTQAGFLRYMEALWPYVTPVPGGWTSPESLVLGCRSFALSRGCRLQGQVLEIPAQREARPSLDQCRAIRRPVPGPGLSRGLPQLLPRSPQKPGQLALGSPHRHDRGRIRPPVHHTG